MAKWSGKIGYSRQVMIKPGVYDIEVVERKQRGDVLTNSWRTSDQNSVNSELMLTTTVSIVADPYVINNISGIAYVEYLGVKWTVTKADPQYPRLNLTLGGVYNGPVPTTD